MENIPSDVMRKIALDLTPPDLIRFCKSSKRPNQVICNSKDFWRMKLAKDFKNYDKDANPKFEYIKKFSFISRSIEILIEKFTSKFDTSSDDLKELYDVLYNLYVKIERESRVSSHEISQRSAHIYDLVIEYVFFPKNFKHDLSRIFKKEESKYDEKMYFIVDFLWQLLDLELL